MLTRSLLDTGMASLDKLRIDSTVVASHIAPPSDSQLLNDGVRVISRLLAKSKTEKSEVERSRWLQGICLGLGPKL